MDTIATDCATQKPCFKYAGITKPQKRITMLKQWEWWLFATQEIATLHAQACLRCQDQWGPVGLKSTLTNRVIYIRCLLTILSPLITMFHSCKVHALNYRRIIHYNPRNIRHATTFRTEKPTVINFHVKPSADER